MDQSQTEQFQLICINAPALEVPPDHVLMFSVCHCGARGIQFTIHRDILLSQIGKNLELIDPTPAHLVLKGRYIKLDDTPDANRFPEVHSDNEDGIERIFELSIMEQPQTEQFQHTCINAPALEVPPDHVLMFNVCHCGARGIQFTIHRDILLSQIGKNLELIDHTPAQPHLQQPEHLVLKGRYIKLDDTPDADRFPEVHSDDEDGIEW